MRTITTALLVPAIASWFAGCGGDERESSPYAAATIWRTAGPDEVPGLVVTLGSSYGAESCAMEAADPSATITVYLPGYEVEPPVTFGFDEDHASGSGTACPGGAGACAEVLNGELHVDSFENDVSATGTFRLDTAAGTTSGPFEADWCIPAGPGG